MGAKVEIEMLDGKKKNAEIQLVLSRAKRSSSGRRVTRLNRGPRRRGFGGSSASAQKAVFKSQKLLKELSEELGETHGRLN